jgi:methanogenic corrinoid protein MtbC1
VTGTYERYLAALSAADAGAATEVLEKAMGHGHSPKQLIRDVLVPGQRRVGELWAAGTWCVADEHAATAVAEQALGVIAPPRTSARGATRVVIACAEGEWHTMPARLAAELARSPKLDVVLLGGSIPATDLRRHLRATAPVALALSATVPTTLIGASRSIQAARAEGIPVIAGGAAWGEGQHRARQLGADLRLDSAEDLWGVIDDADDIEDVVGPQPPLEENPIPAEALLLDSPTTELVQAVLERRVPATGGTLPDTADQHEQAVRAVRWLARSTAASIACDDPTILRDALAWLLTLSVARGIPTTPVIDSCFHLAEAVETDMPAASHCLRHEAQRAHADL